jgi:diguanylate cyclase (GGDEF)-like protein
LRPDSRLVKAGKMIVRGVTAQKAGKVLIVNSDLEINKILECNLGCANLEVISALSGAEALQKICAEKVDIIIIDPSLPDVDGKEICRKIKELPQTKNTPIVIISSRPQKSNKKTQVDEINNYFISKPFNPNDIISLVQGHLAQKERMENTNLLTGLPNRTQIIKEIDQLIHQKTTFAALFVAMHDFKAINRVHGYSEGDRVIQLLADIVSETLRLSGGPEDLAGYFGGDKFVVLSTPWKVKTLCRRIIADFNRRIKVFRADDLLQTAQEGSLSEKEQAPNMSIHIAVVTNQKRNFKHPLEVAEAASEQIEYLKSSPESNCYFDLKVNGIEPSLTLARKEMVHARKKELKAMQGVLSWFNFLTAELNKPVGVMKDCLQCLDSIKPENLNQSQLNGLKELKGNFSHLKRVLEGIENLAKSHELRADAFFDEVDIKKLLSWIVEQVKDLTMQRDIEIEIQVIGVPGRMMGDKKSLTQALLYIIRNEVQSSPGQSNIYICLSEKDKENINIEITNPNHYVNKGISNHSRQGIWQREALNNEIYPAGVLIRGLGGSLDVTSEKAKGTIYKITIPQKWQSWRQEVDVLQMATDVSRKEAREAIRNLQNLLASGVEQASPTITDNIERLRGKVQELGVLCNRSQFLADDLSSRLEAQQEHLLQQEIEQVATIEAFLMLCREMVKSMHIDNMFELERGKQVVKYALSIAGEFKLLESERQALRNAALLKDIALAFSPHKPDEQLIFSGNNIGGALKERISLCWKMLSAIPFFTPACNLMLHKYERYDGNGGLFGIKGDYIPLGSKILAVAESFDALISGHSPLGKLSIKQAVERIAAESGQGLDPHVVNAFLILWKRKELELVSGETAEAVDKV